MHLHEVAELNGSQGPEHEKALIWDFRVSLPGEKHSFPLQQINILVTV